LKEGNCLSNPKIITPPLEKKEDHKLISASLSHTSNLVISRTNDVKIKDTMEYTFLEFRSEIGLGPSAPGFLSESLRRHCVSLELNAPCKILGSILEESCLV